MTAPAVTAPPARTGPGSATRRLLARLLAALLAVTAVVFASTLLTWTRVHRAAGTVRDRTAPALVELAAARLALVRADVAVIGGLRDAGLPLLGAGEEFQNQLAIAGQ